MEWHAFDVDGETFYWTAHPSKSRVDKGPWVDDVMLQISRTPDTPGVGRGYPAGTMVSEEHAIDTVKLFKAHGRQVP
jgi:hypothetical protein